MRVIGNPQGRSAPTCRAPFLLAVLVTLFADGASAHTGVELLGGFLSGFEHPIVGIDHLLAMLAVGIWGAQMGGRAIWTLPVAFPLIMALGGIAGIAGLPLPQVETGIALSLLVLGLVVATAFRPLEGVAVAIIGVFAVFHGYAHGAELPSAADPAAYSAGFVIATGLIHLAGIGIGLSTGRVAGGWLARGAGGAIAVGGVYFLLA
jgi:urease accessory protein